MQTVVVPHDVSSFQVICEECLSTAGKDGAIARLVSGTIRGGRAAGRRVLPRRPPRRGAQVEPGVSAAAIGHAA